MTLAVAQTLEEFERPDPVAWKDVCAVEQILPGTAVAALIDGEQIAIVRPDRRQRLFALSNFDPFSQAFVIARGIVGDKDGVLKIASPIYKQTFELSTGRCLDDDEVRLPTYPVRVVQGRVEIGRLPISRRAS